MFGLAFNAIKCSMCFCLRTLIESVKHTSNESNSSSKEGGQVEGVENFRAVEEGD